MLEVLTAVSLLAVESSWIWRCVFACFPTFRQSVLSSFARVKRCVMDCCDLADGIKTMLRNVE